MNIYENQTSCVIERLLWVQLPLGLEREGLSQFNLVLPLNFSTLHLEDLIQTQEGLSPRT